MSQRPPASARSPSFLSESKKLTSSLLSRKLAARRRTPSGEKRRGFARGASSAHLGEFFLCTRLNSSSPTGTHKRTDATRRCMQSTSMRPARIRAEAGSISQRCASPKRCSFSPRNQLRHREAVARRRPRARYISGAYRGGSIPEGCVGIASLVQTRRGVCADSDLRSVKHVARPATTS